MRFVSDPEEIKKHEFFMSLAAEEAVKSKCKKSQRGSVIVKDDKPVSFGHNAPMRGGCCLRDNIGDNSRVELCNAIHAEEMALLNARQSLVGSVMYHTKLKHRVQVPVGPPSCTICSRKILFSGIKEFVLWQKTVDGPKLVIYNAKELNDLSYEYFKK